MATKYASATITDQSTGKKLRFSGVTAVRVSQSLKIATGSDAEGDADLVNGARNQPTKITLSVQETEANGTARSQIAELTALREGRKLCRVRTPLLDLRNLLLTDFSATRDETTPYGWSGVLTFTEAGSGSSAEQVAANGLSNVRSLSTAEVRKILERAGIRT